MPKVKMRIISNYLPSGKVVPDCAWWEEDHIWISSKANHSVENSEAHLMTRCRRAAIIEGDSETWIRCHSGSTLEAPTT